ncbi:hypothetical protein [Promicromonospora soli]
MTNRARGGGGTAATAGFRYQFLRTAEEVLRLYDRASDGGWSVLVESDVDDVVDFQVLEHTEQPATLTAQVKSSLPSAGTSLGRAEAVKILTSLANRHPGDVALVVHRNLSSEAREALDALNSGVPVAGVDPAHRSRMRIDYDTRTIADVQAALGKQIRRIRTRAGLPVSDRVNGVIAACVVDLVFEKASTPGDHLLASSDMRALLQVTGAQLAQAIGRNPHWTPLGAPLSLMASLPRSEISAYLDSGLVPESLDTAQVRLAAVTGAPGMGKGSAVAAWYKESHDRYSVALWTDANDPKAFQEQIRSLLVSYDGLSVGKASEKVPLSDLFKQYLQALPFPWLLVIDGANSARQVRDWIPTEGFGHVLVTTTDATWPATLGACIELEQMGDETGFDLVCSTLGRQRSDISTDEAGAVHAILDAMGGWPLALMMASTWIRDSRGGLANVGLYLEDLARIDLGDEAYQPFGYPRTAASAIVHAVESLPTSGSAALAPDRLLAATAHLGAHQVPTLVAVQLAQGDLSAEVDDVTVDHAVQMLRRRALIERSWSPTTIDPRFGDRVSMHGVIARVVRTKLLRQNAADMTDGAAFLLIEHLSYGVQGDLPFALSLVPAASNIVSDIPRLADKPAASAAQISPGLLVLAGSLAKVLSLDGRHQEAYDLLRAEIAVLAKTGQTWRGTAVDQTQRTQNLLIAHSDAVSIAQSIGDRGTFLNDLEALVDVIEGAAQYDVEAFLLREVCDAALQAIDGARLNTDRTLSLAARVSRVRGVAAEAIPDLPESSRRLHHQAEEMLGRDPEQALTLAIQALSVARHPLDQLAEMLLVAECLAFTGSAEESVQLAKKALTFATANGLKESAHAGSLLEIATALALQAVFGSDPDDHGRSVTALGHVMALIDHGRDSLNAHSRARYDTYRSVHATLTGVGEVESLTRTARASLTDAHNTGAMVDEQYELFSNAIIEAGLKAAGVSHDPVVGNDSVTIIRTHPDGVAVSVGFGLTDAGPALAFHHPNPPIISDGAGNRDMIEENFRLSGLPASHPPGQIPTLKDWRASIGREDFQVFDGDKNLIFQYPQSNLSPDWLAAVRKAGFIWFVYGGRSALEMAQIEEGTYEKSNAYVRLSRWWSRR